MAVVTRLRKAFHKKNEKANMPDVQDLLDAEFGFTPINTAEAWEATEQLNADVAREEYSASPLGHLEDSAKSAISAGNSFFKTLISGIKFVAYTIGSVFQVLKGGFDSVKSDASWVQEAANSGYDTVKHGIETVRDALDAGGELGCATAIAAYPYMESAATKAYNALTSPFDFSGEEDFALKPTDVLGLTSDME